MRARVLALFAAAVCAGHAAGCGHCRCCGERKEGEVPRSSSRGPDLMRNEGPPPVVVPSGPSAPPQTGVPKQTGAYGGN